MVNQPTCRQGMPKPPSSQASHTRHFTAHSTVLSTHSTQEKNHKEVRVPRRHLLSAPCCDVNTSLMYADVSISQGHIARGMQYRQCTNVRIPDGVMLPSYAYSKCMHVPDVSLHPCSPERRVLCSVLRSRGVNTNTASIMPLQYRGAPKRIE